MPFRVVRNDIARMQVDAIVNTANPRPVIGSGTDTAIHAAAGPELLEARKQIGTIKTGTCAITPAFGLDARYVIHTVGPVWRGGLFGEARLLRSCYDEALKLAAAHGCKSIAFPLISTGNYGFPKDKALQIAIAAFSEFLPEQEMDIYLVIWGQDTLRLSEKMFHRVASYIDEHYIRIAERKEYGAAPIRREQIRRRRDREMEEYSRDMAPDCMPCPAMPMAAPREAFSLQDMLAQEDAGFSETLLKLIDQSGKKDSAIYKKANLSKQHFSKIRNNPNYKPTKATALALAIALELDLEATKDLIGRAGYALTNSSKFDLIIRYFIEQKNYNIVEINIALYEFDQSLLGS